MGQALGQGPLDENNQFYQDYNNNFYNNYANPDTFNPHNFNQHYVGPASIINNGLNTVSNPWYNYNNYNNYNYNNYNYNNYYNYIPPWQRQADLSYIIGNGPYPY